MAAVDFETLEIGDLDILVQLVIHEVMSSHKHVPVLRAVFRECPDICINAMEKRKLLQEQVKRLGKPSAALWEVPKVSSAAAQEEQCDMCGS